MKPMVEMVSKAPSIGSFLFDGMLLKLLKESDQKTYLFLKKILFSFREGG